MHIKVTIDIAKNKYGTTLANTEFELNSDDIDAKAFAVLVTGMATSAMNKAQAYKVAEEQTPPKIEPLVSTLPADKETF